jgi:poly [ADP-ribose] polymerase 10/14/15
MTSAEFANRYQTRYKSEVSYQGASVFASGASLVAAIEVADSLNTEKVAEALRGLQLREFYGPVAFNAYGQNEMDMLGLQYAPGSQEAEVVYPQSAVTGGNLTYPMPTWAQRRCRVLGPKKTWEDSVDVTIDTLARECSGNGLCNEKGLCVCKSGWDGDSCSHRTVVEETGLPVWGTALIVVGIVIIGICFFCVLCKSKNRHIKRIEGELQEFKNSVVGMRSVVQDFMPVLEGAALMQDTPTQPQATRAMWYWAEDASRLGSHNQNLIYPPHWVQYAGGVAAELEEKYALYKNGKGQRLHQTDLTDRISSTGTEAKSHGQDSGAKYTIDFEDMKQINSKSKYERAILRREVPTEAPLAPAVTVTSASAGMSFSASPSTNGIPKELAKEVFLALKTGSIVQVSKQRSDGWAYGNVIYNPDGEMAPPSDGISFDAGWFPMEYTTPPTKEALKQLQDMVGPAGADCLAPPSSWTDLKDPLIAELFSVPDSPEKQSVATSFLRTLSSNVQVVKVERIQNLSLWQSFAVKRQTMLSREGKTATAADTLATGLERMWLFHGTKVDLVPKIVQQGFNRSFCGRNATMYGKGVYFARDAAYSSSRTYAEPDSSGIQRMFLCRVLVGEYSQGQKDAIAPGVRDAKAHVLYDTTVDNMKDPSIYVTYHDAQAYPEYLVHFKQ